MPDQRNMLDQTKMTAPIPAVGAAGEQSHNNKTNDIIPKDRNCLLYTSAFARRRRLRGDGIQMMIHAHSLRLFTKSRLIRLYHGAARLKSSQTVRLPSANLPKSAKCANFFPASLDFI